jgi:hypothetical protein
MLYLLIKPYFIRIFLQNIYTTIVHDKKEQNYSTSIISLENSESSLPASKSQSNSESGSLNEIIKGSTFSNERFPINFAQSSQYLQKCWQISGVHFKIDLSHKFTTLSRSNNRSYKTPVPFQLGRCFFLHYPCYIPGDQEVLFKLAVQLRKKFNSVIYNTATGYVLLVYLTNI